MMTAVTMRRTIMVSRLSNAPMKDRDLENNCKRYGMTDRGKSN